MVTPYCHGGPTFVYRLYDEDDILLYVGVTNNVKSRFEQHADDKYWWGWVQRHRLEEHPNRGAALRAEMDAIRTEHPVFNLSGRPPADGLIDRRVYRLIKELRYVVRCPESFKIIGIPDAFDVLEVWDGTPEEQAIADAIGTALELFAFRLAKGLVV